MARKPTGNPNGAPLKDINWKQFEQLCALLCTQVEIAGFFQISIDTLSDRVQRQYGEGYSEVYKKLSQAGKLSLRRNQFVLSKTNASMAIWLGKQWLGQKDDPADAYQKTNKLVQVLLGEIMAMKAISREISKES